MTEDGDLPRDPISATVARIDAVLHIFLANDLGFDQALIDAISHQVLAQDAPVRAEFRGDRPLIAAKGPQEVKARRQAIEEARRTGRVREASTKYGVSRATLYRHLGRR